MESYPPEAWQRVGRLLIQRRVQLSKRYRVRKVFARERGITDKTAQEIENAYRTTFSEEMIAAIESAYEIASGSFEKALADPDMTEFPDRAGDGELRAVPDIQLGAAGDPHPADPVTGLGGLWDDPLNSELRIWSGFPEVPWRVRANWILMLREEDQKRGIYRGPPQRRPRPHNDGQKGADNGTAG